MLVDFRRWLWLSGDYEDDCDVTKMIITILTIKMVMRMISKV